ncbi:hypothetical protein CAPTEDRAFT_199696 [Capitella teleta]|uniref:Uncharacterized protein n=1 Tax=Capitella teleta TaxID=283909 RepID=R7V3X1_CAPTE|nr:hypothetical protein CAPTEDRAFT_199696 [Capitella teleta]|eukprot:ELU13234.1 hypothetical protein CAPTEDRAFT_199696 [Capitella teleta]
MMQITNVSPVVTTNELKEYVLAKEGSLSSISIEDKTGDGWETKRFVLTIPRSAETTVWKSCDKPRDGIVFDLRQNTKREYHYALRRYKREERALRRERMGAKMTSSDDRSFWKEVQNVNPKKRKTAPTIDSAVTDIGIANIFGDKYKTLYNSVPSNPHEMRSITSQLSEALSQTSTNAMTVTLAEVIVAVKRLKSCKHDGSRRMWSNYLIWAPENMLKHLSLLLSAMLVSLVTVASNQRKRPWEESDEVNQNPTDDTLVELFKIENEWRACSMELARLQAGKSSHLFKFNQPGIIDASTKCEELAPSGTISPCPLCPMDHWEAKQSARLETHLKVFHMKHSFLSHDTFCRPPHISVQAGLPKNSWEDPLPLWLWLFQPPSTCCSAQHCPVQLDDAQVTTAAAAAAPLLSAPSLEQQQQQHLPPLRLPSQQQQQHLPSLHLPLQQQQQHLPSLHLPSQQQQQYLPSLHLPSEQQQQHLPSQHLPSEQQQQQHLPPLRLPSQQQQQYLPYLHLPSEQQQQHLPSQHLPSEQQQLSR